METKEIGFKNDNYIKKKTRDKIKLPPQRSILKDKKNRNRNRGGTEERG